MSVSHAQQRPAMRRNVPAELLALPGAIATVLGFVVTGYAAPSSHVSTVIAELSVLVAPLMALGTILSLVLTPFALVKFVAARRFNPIAIVLILLSLFPFVVLLTVLFQ